MFVTKAIGNVYAGGLAVIFGLAVAASLIRDMIGSFIRQKKSKENA
ncbi:hypothetical protein [Bacillus paramycoides]